MIIPHGATVAPPSPPSLHTALLAQRPTARLTGLYHDTDQSG